jgi:hypothetical protein
MLEQSNEYVNFSGKYYMLIPGSFLFTFAPDEVPADHTTYLMENTVFTQFRAWAHHPLSAFFYFPFKQKMVPSGLQIKEVLGRLDHVDSGTLFKDRAKDPFR